MFKSVIESRSKTFLTFCFCFLAGITLASFINKRFDFGYFYLAFLVLIGYLVIFWTNKNFRYILIGVTIFCLGFVRYNFGLPADWGKEIKESQESFNAIVAGEPDVRQDGVRYIVIPTLVGISPAGSKDQRIYVKSSLYPRYEYGDVLKIDCKIVKPKPIEDFRFDMYLAKEGVFRLCQSAQIKKIGAGEGSVAFAKILELKNKFTEKVVQLWPEPYASFMAGILYGYRGGSTYLNTVFANAGISHILAISGYNISIIANILIIICVHLWIPRKKAFWLLSTGIVLFVIFTGASGSVVRAGIMGILVLLAKQLGRKGRIANAMALTAVGMTLQNPFILIWDVGFQLSFISTLGLVYLSPLLEKYFSMWPDTFKIKETMVSTMSAIIATLPLIIFQFGRLSLVAPLVNILVLWTVPFLMILGFLSILFSFIYFPLANLAAWLPWFGMKYVIEVAKFLSDFSFSQVTFSLPLSFMILLYTVLVYVIAKKRRIMTSL